MKALTRVMLENIPALGFLLATIFMTPLIQSLLIGANDWIVKGFSLLD